MAKTLGLPLHSQIMSLNDDMGLEALLFPASSSPIPPHTLTTVPEYSCLVQSLWCFLGLSTLLFSRPWPGLFFLLPVGGLCPEEQRGSALTHGSSLVLLSTWDPSSAAQLNPASIRPSIRWRRAPSEPRALSAFLANGCVCLPLILSCRAHRLSTFLITLSGILLLSVLTLCQMLTLCFCLPGGEFLCSENHSPSVLALLSSPQSPPLPSPSA